MPAPVQDAPVVSAPAAAKAPVAEIKVSGIPPPVAPAAPAKKGSAREGLLQRMEKRFGGEEPPPAPNRPGDTNEPNKPAVGKAAPPAGEPVKESVEGEEPPEGAPAGEPAAKAGDPVKPAVDKKKNPWKLLDEERKARTAAETARAEVEKRAIPEADWKAKNETLTKLEARNKELEDEIRYVNYEKSEEFQTKHQAPYEAAWKRALGELGELTVEDPNTGASRNFKAQDLLTLVNMPLQQAREHAVAIYGDFADDVMHQRKEIRRIYDERSAALAEVRKNGGEREKQAMEAEKAQVGEVSKVVGEAWTHAHEAVTKHEKYGKYFSPVEGDEEGNTRLKNGLDLAVKAFSENPNAKGLTPEQRREIVERHAVVINRAAAFGRLTSQVEKAQARIAELEKELGTYKGTEPEVRGAQAGQPAGEQGTAMSKMQQRLRKRAVNA